MTETSRELSIIAYYLSEYDMKAVKELGYQTRQEAFEDISIIFKKENNYLKLRRDEFDVLTNSPRKGWRNREVAPDVQRMFNELSGKSYSEMTVLVKNIISEARTEEQKRTIEIKEDDEYISVVNKKICAKKGKKNIISQPKPVPQTQNNTTSSYKRNPVVALNALCNADYKCEYCPTHVTFKRKTNNLPYTEPHHLVPMSTQKDFSVSLDVENNIVSLCSNCHNLLHYGTDFEPVLKKLYDERKSELEKAGIRISFEELMKYYE